MNKEKNQEIKRIIEEPKDKEWESLKKIYGEAIANEIKQPLTNEKGFLGIGINKRINRYTQKIKEGIKKENKKEEEEPIPKGKEPYLFMQMKSGITKTYEGVTTGVYEYDGSDGKRKKVWLSQKYISTLPWGQDTLRYYNCTEDYPIPHGLNDQKELAEMIERLINKIQLDHEKLRTSEYNAKAKQTGEIFMGIVKVVGALGAVIVLPMLFGINIIELIRGNEKEIVEVIVQNATNVTEAMGSITVLG